MAREEAECGNRRLPYPQDQALTETIAKIHARSRCTYGAPRVHAELRDDFGVRVGRKRVARLMRSVQLEEGAPAPRARTAPRDPALVPPGDLVKRAFTAPALDQVWIADITYVPTGEGLYLAVVLDVFSRKAVGWAMADHMRTELVIDALEVAVRNRRPAPGLTVTALRGRDMRRCRSVNAAGQRVSERRRAASRTESFFATLEEGFSTPAAVLSPRRAARPAASRRPAARRPAGRDVGHP